MAVSWKAQGDLAPVRFWISSGSCRDYISPRDGVLPFSTLVPFVTLSLHAVTDARPIILETRIVRVL